MLAKKALTLGSCTLLKCYNAFVSDERVALEWDIEGIATSCLDLVNRSFSQRFGNPYRGREALDYRRIIREAPLLLSVFLGNEDEKRSGYKELNGLKIQHLLMTPKSWVSGFHQKVVRAGVRNKIGLCCFVLEHSFLVILVSTVGECYVSEVGLGLGLVNKLLSPGYLNGSNRCVETNESIRTYLFARDVRDGAEPGSSGHDLVLQLMNSVVPLVFQR
ncbi:hypothetical protein Tco_0488048 [Tanacetum coccineum]